MNTALVKPSASYISKSGHYASDKLSDIEKMESEIKGLYGEMGVKYDDWCKTEKDRILSSYIVSDSSRFRQMLLKIAMPAAMFCGVGYYGGTYAVSTDEINAYEQRMKAADGILPMEITEKPLQVLYKPPTCMTEASEHHLTRKEHCHKQMFVSQRCKTK